MRKKVKFKITETTSKTSSYYKSYETPRVVSGKSIYNLLDDMLGVFSGEYCSSLLDGVIKTLQDCRKSKKYGWEAKVRQEEKGHVK